MRDEAERKGEAPALPRGVRVRSPLSEESVLCVPTVPSASIARRATPSSFDLAAASRAGIDRMSCIFPKVVEAILLCWLACARLATMRSRTLRPGPSVVSAISSRSARCNGRAP